MQQYVHGYSERETVRLRDQAETLSELLHHDSLFPPRCTVLEVGCGTGAQTVHLARLNPQPKAGELRRSGRALFCHGLSYLRYLV